MFGSGLIQKLKVIKRFNYILLVVFRAGFGALLRRAKLARHVPLAHRLDADKRIGQEDLPVKFRQALEKLGPVFVKFGQILSTRADLLPKDFILELEKLQTSVEPFGFYEARRIVEENFNRPLEKVFKKFENLPFASASLGQVYRAELKSGEKVAVKVQRPKAKELIKLDTQVLLLLAHFAEKHIEGARNFRPTEMVQEFQRWTVNELDYRKEATNCEIFNNFFKDDEHIYGPKVFWDYSGESVLTLEFVDGDSLGEILADKHKNKVNKKLVCQRLTDSFIRQYFEYGYFHADPHPGNIFVTKGNQLMFLDFGMIGFMDSQLTALSAGIFLALLQKDVEKILAIILQIEQRYDERAQRQDVYQLVNVNALRKELTQLVLQWASTGRAGEFTRLFYDLVNMAVKNGVVVPVDLVMFSKSIITLDIVVHGLDPNLKIEEWEKPLVEKIIMERLKTSEIKSRTQDAVLALDELLKRLPETTANIVSNLEHGRFGMELNTEQLLQYERLLNTNSKFNTYGTLFAGIIIALALIYQSGTHPIAWRVTLPGWGVYLGIGLLLWLFFRTRKQAS